MRPAHVLRWLAGAGGLAVTSWLSAQTVAPAATDPNAPTSALQHPPLASSGSIVNEPGDWRQANAAVAAFARGHADVIAWEKAQAAPAAPKAMPAGAMQMHEHSAHGQHGAPGGQQ
ncbi:hypothetical protein HS961_11830 [Comamonas piscis]|uniref:DUF4148 domain-containing protein n=1 Tax=Comamonas piscis TaxID=1562974 RepID=A0A7G5EHI4_9BURK|nr:hypothetical protein [Comamonas piscis]QMV73459.1 hypothetical protein HS961_11830 [Comamonas piscis]WSO31874.1 hypothetical protein VUJ63_11865 [Comamonas piscis]